MWGCVSVGAENIANYKLDKLDNEKKKRKEKKKKKRKKRRASKYLGASSAAHDTVFSPAVFPRGPGQGRRHRGPLLPPESGCAVPVSGRSLPICRHLLFFLWDS